MKDLRPEMKKEAGGFSRELSSARPVSRFFFCERAFQREDGPKRLHLFLRGVEFLGELGFVSTLRAF